MGKLNVNQIVGKAAFVLLVIAGSILAGTLPAASHGGKSHGDEAFTSLQAVQKATELYDRLIASGKLPEAWETGLKTIAVSRRNAGQAAEYVVQFQRTEGDPQSVYFFFKEEGEYAGSNFSGK